ALKYLEQSWPFQIFYWYLFKPLVAYTLLALLFPQLVDSWPHRLMVFVLLMVAITSRLGRAAAELVNQSFATVYEWLRAGLLRARSRFVIYLFKRVNDTIEYVLYPVDEWLRFKSGDSPASMVVRAVTALLWFPISYVARIYTVVLIEPMFNPLKLPVAILAAKFLYPFFWPLTELLSEPLIPLAGPYVAGGFAFAKG